MAFIFIFVVLIIYHELIKGSISVELSRKYLTDEERLLTFQQENENNELYQRLINFQVYLVD